MRFSPAFPASLLMLVAAAAAGPAALAAPPRVVTVRLDNEAITPVTARFLARTLRAAAVDEAECVVVILDTPGGLVESTREAVKEILGSRVPVVV